LVVEDFEEEEPHQLANALGIAVYASIFTHNVLYGFDGAR
jgi:hypothetical protein